MATTSTSADVVASSSSTGGSPSTSRGEDDQRAVDEQTQFELLIAIERFLEGGNFGRAAAALRSEINQRKLVPARTDFEGTNHERDYHQFLSSMANVPGNITQHTLPTMISRLSTLSDRLIAPPVKGLKLRLITNKRSSLQKTNDVLLPPRRHSLLHGSRGNAGIPKTKYAPIEILRAREMGTRVTASLLPGVGALDIYDKHYRVWLHLSSCFCVTFDKTENYIITGADDNLIKVFNVNLGLLKFTYRGHASEIADITVSHCNQLVASASTDKVVRVWKLQNGETMSVLKCHQAGITSIKFLPFVENGSNRYLVTTGNDCIINFHMFNQETLEFPQGSRSIAFTRNERDQHGAKMISICYSEGGHVVVAGESHGTLRVYRVHPSGVIEKTNDIIAHTDRVDSLMFANKGMKFASGSKDGLVKIWRFQCGEWTETTLALCQEELLLICGMNAFQNNPNSRNRYKVSMICWTKDDSFLITTGSDYSFRVWDATDGTQLHKLSFHTDDVYHVLPHPVHPHVIFSAGHDGNVIAWDVVRGVRLTCMQTTVTTEPVSIYDMAVARNGTLLAVVDNKGFLHVVGLGTSQQNVLTSQFFQTDYHPLFTDDAGFAMDANTGLAPHLMNPRLTNEKHELHPSEFQAMVPDRDYLGPAGRPGDPPGIVPPEMLVCPWLLTDIVPRLDENEMMHWTARQAALSATESEDYLREMQRVRSDPAPIVPFNLSPVRAPRAAVSIGAASAAERQAVRQENQRNRVTVALQMAQLREDVTEGFFDDDVAVADDDSDPGMTEDEMDEDYESDGETRGRRERERAREEVRGAEEAYSSQGTASRPRRRRVEIDDDDEEAMDENSQQNRSMEVDDQPEQREEGEEEEEVERMEDEAWPEEDEVEKESTTISMVVEEWTRGQTEQISTVHRISGYPWRLRLFKCSRTECEKRYSCGGHLELICDKSNEAELWKCTATIKSTFHRYPLSHMFNSWDKRTQCCRISVARNGVASDKSKTRLSVVEVEILTNDNGERWRCCPIIDPFNECDGILVIGGEKKKIHVNNESLASQSPFFDRLFNGDLMENESAEIPIEDVEYEEFCNILKMVYRLNGVSLTDDNVCRVLQLADRFALKIVEDRVISYLLSSSSSIDIHQQLLISEQYSLPFLKERLIARYSIFTLASLIDSKVWDGISRETVVTICKKFGDDSESDPEPNSSESDDSPSDEYYQIV